MAVCVSVPLHCTGCTHAVQIACLLSRDMQTPVSTAGVVLAIQQAQLQQKARPCCSCNNNGTVNTALALAKRQQGRVMQVNHMQTLHQPSY